VVCCFLSGICQRDYTQYYHHISNQEENVCQAIQTFFQEHIRYNFPDEDCEFLERGGAGKGLVRLHVDL
jgi:hypothetical protein